jgi:phosphohistidine phosphatase
MKTLYLLRHAKSSWSDPSVSDRDRPLAPRGVRAAALVATHLQRAGIRPALVLCSPASRTRQTLDAMVPSLGDATEIRMEEDLYGASAGELMARVRNVAQGVSSVMVVGHNPALQDVGLELAGDGEEVLLARLRAKFPTAALATLDLADGGWATLGQGRAVLTALVFPRELRDDH